jgi:endonuclease-3
MDMGGRAKSQSNQRVSQLLDVLQATWGHAVCELAFASPYQLLVATILSAQSTDKRVNLVTPTLFARFPGPAELADADPAEVEDLIRSTGFFRNKTKSIIGMAQRVMAEHGGEVPADMDALLALPGVARKTANVVLGTAFGIASGVVVDTHIKRVAARLGLTSHADPVKIERDLMAAVPRDRWIDLGHQLIWHGRRVCHARKPDCESCSLAPLCPSREVA